MTEVTGILFGVLALIAVALRCWSRFSIGKKIELDDWTIVIAAFVICGLIVVDTRSMFII